jgi:hypothetical protein
VYLHFRMDYEKLTPRSNKPVVLTGNSDHMILPNDSEFGV